MANLYKNKIVYGNDVLMDITDTTATPDGVVEGQVFYGANGARNVGTLGLVTTTTNGLMAAVDKAKLDGINISCKTTAEWQSDLTYVPALGEIIIYSDGDSYVDETSGETVPVPNIKIGDGMAYCVDLPFIHQAEVNRILQQLDNHIRDTTVHITAAERTFWNNKLNYGIDGELLTFNRN